MEQLKVLVISNYSGINSSRPEAEAMIGLAAKGIAITVMTPAHAEYAPLLRKAGIQVIDFQPKRKFDRNEIQFIRQELIRGNYNLLHLFNGKAIINGLRAAKGLKVKVLLYRGYCGNIHWWDPTAYFKYLHPRTTAIWCIAPAVADLINRNTLFTRKKAVCISKGHHPEWYRDVPQATLTESGIPHGAFVVSMVANARRMKGLKYLLKASYFIDQSLPVYFLLVGRDLDKGRLKKLAEKSPNAKKIIFTGYRPDALQWVKASDVFVLSSIFGEAICKSVIEAMSVGVAPVITDIAGNRGLVIDQQNGLVVPRKNAKAIADAILKMYHEPDLRLKYANAAPKHIAENYHIQQTIENLHKWYFDVAGI